MWLGRRFGASCLIHYGRNGGNVKHDQADKFVCALSNNGFWNGGDDFIHARVKRTDIGNLKANDWMYYSGGAGLAENLDSSIHKVLFLGNSITYAGNYITDIETYYFTQLSKIPKIKFELV